MKNIRLVIPDDLQGEMKVHDVLVCPTMDGVSVLTMLHDMTADALGHVVRVYMLREETDEFIVDFELEAFSFPSYEAAVLFASRMPNLTAIELLMIQNGYDFKLMKGTPKIYH